jgi:hypothetical protein
MAGRAARVLGGQSQALPDPADGLAREDQALLLAQFLRHMAIIESGIDRLEEVGHARPHRRRQPARRGPASGLMHQADHPEPLEAAFEPLHLPDPEVQRCRRLSIPQCSRHQTLEQPGPQHFLARHRECLPCLHGGDIFTSQLGGDISMSQQQTPGRAVDTPEGARLQ